MPSIYLKQTGPYKAGSENVNVHQETYPTSNLFKRFKHALTSLILREICIYDRKLSQESNLVTSDSWDNYLKLTTGSTRQFLVFKEIHVYFNKFDNDNQYPLILVLVFKKGKPPVDNKYYIRSEFTSKFTRSESVSISNLKRYDNEKGLIVDLLKENDKIDKPLTYDIGKIKGDDEGNDIYLNKYNNNKIIIEDNLRGQPTLSGNGFRRYIHTPANGHDGKKACVIYDGNVLMQKDGRAEVQNIQEQQYQSICVYFGEKAKKTSLTKPGEQIEVPLLIELTKKDPPSEPDYYIHKKNPKGGKYYWEKLPGTDGNANTLKDLLTDMGFGMTKSDAGYNELQKLLKKALDNGVGVGESETDLSTKLSEVKGTKLQRLLSQKIPESSSGPGPQKSLLVLLLEKIQFDLVDAVIILLEKRNPPTDSQYGESDVNSVVGSLEPKREINRVKMNNGIDKNITVKDATGEKGQCVKNYNYNVYEHDLTQVVQGLVEPGRSHVGIRFIIPSEKNEREYKQLRLYDNKNEPQNLEYNYYHKGGGSSTNSDKVYVWFYDGSDGAGKGDPRPLLLCYGGSAYAPKDKESYFTRWAKVNELSNGTAGALKDCGCPQGLGDHTPESDNKLLQNLDRVVKFLNTVNLKEGTSNGKDSHTYTVHNFKNQQIQIEVTCSPVGSEPPPPPGTCSASISNKSCYKKFVHKHAGMTNGGGEANNGSGYRLGEVQYRTNGGGSGQVKGTLNYKTLTSKHPYDPLVGVSVFYYDKDTDYSDPLLIELEFKKINGGAGGTRPKEYYKLKANGGGTRSELQWSKDDKASSQMSSNAVEHLDSIRYSLKPVIKIYIEKQTPYQLCLSQQPGGKGNGYSNGNGKQIEVQQYQNNGCQELANQGYKCYVHKVSEIKENGQFDYNRIGGLKFFISGSSGNDIEIPLHIEYESPLSPITYNTCMKNIYVFFYCKNGTTKDCTITESSKPTAPLMLLYNKNYYKPKDIDNYFTEWICEKGLKGTNDKPCDGDNGTHTTLLDKLNEVNKSLNRIKLTHSISTGLQYGIPKPQQPSPRDPNIKLERIEVKKIPGTDNRPYCKLVHRTINSFTIGDIVYNNKNITENGGIQVNGNSIKVNGGNNNHTQFVKTSSPNTVVAYYSSSDENHKLPQLILLLQTDGPISESQTITSSSGTKYGYYIINHSNDYCIYFEYDWIEPDNTGTQLKLDDTTELSLLNSVVILMEKRPNSGTTPPKNDKYNETDIKSAIDKAIQSKSLTSSPGIKNNDINRLKHKNITLKDVTEEGSGESFLKDTGFRVISHDISTIVNLKINGSTGLTLIARLIFLIPTPKGDGEYRLLSLYESVDRKENITLFHQKDNDSVCVYFYGQDPRPLLLCYNKTAYRAFSLPSYDNQRWYRGTSITDCVCNKPKKNILLQALVKVTNTLNPVEIYNTDSTYNIHKFNGQEISIKVTKTSGSEKFCYDKYVHIHNGIGKGGTGFRLGTINYRCFCIYGGLKKSLCISSVIRYKEKYEPASEVVVYYYRGDPTHRNPLLVALCKNGDRSDISTCTSKRYYELQRDPVNDHKKYKKESKDLNLDPDKGKQLEKILDAILFNISKRLQIILGQQPKPIKLCPIERKRIKFVRSNKVFDQPSYPEMGYQLLTDAIFGASQMAKYMIEEGLIGYKNSTYEYMIKNNCEKRKSDQYDPKLTQLPQSYKARVYDNTGKQDPGPSNNRDIEISGPFEIKTSSGDKTGYKCYQHKLTTVKDVNQIGGLRLFLWDNRQDTNDNDSECKASRISTQDKKKCCEIDLYGDCSQTSGGSSTNGKIDPIAYTTCKGDLYVYFYGSDPRPLLLCYNGQAYKPENMDDYDQKWCRVPGIESCECSEKGFDPSSVLKTLYQISMFLNPVNLSETIKAYNKVVKPELERRKKAKETGEPVGKWPEHNYTVQTFGDTDIKMKVQATDLLCYRQYTFASAMVDSGGVVKREFRLGDIYYGENDKRGSTETCLTYPQELPLQSVSLYYYMFDQPHHYPLIVQLDYGFGGPLDDYYRVCKTGESGAAQAPGPSGSGGGGSGGGGGGAGNGGQAAQALTKKIAENITWVKMKCSDNSEGKPEAKSHAQAHSDQTTSSSASSSGSSSINGKCDPACSTPTTPEGKKLDNDTIDQLKEQDREFVKRAHEIQEKINRLNLAEAWFSQDYLYLVAQLQTLIERRCYDVRKKFEIEYKKGDNNENLKHVNNSINKCDTLDKPAAQVCKALAAKNISNGPIFSRCGSILNGFRKEVHEKSTNTSGISGMLCVRAARKMGK